MAYSFQRVPNTPFVMKTPYIAYPHLFRIFSNPSSLLPLTFISTTLFDVFFLWLNERTCHIWCVILLINIMDLHILSLGTLVVEQLCSVFMQKGVKFTEVWHIMCFLLVLWFDITNTHTHKHTQPTQRPF